MCGGIMGVFQKFCKPETSCVGGFASDEEREEAIMSQLSLVKMLAQKIQDKLPRHIELDDLVSAGIFGLIESASRYDKAQSASFHTFCYSRIRGAILDSLRDEDFGSRKIRQKAKQVEETLNSLTALFGRKPTEHEMASALQISIDKYRALQQNLWMLDIESADEQCFTADGREKDLLINLIPDQSTPDPYSTFEQKESIFLMQQAVESLPDRQKTVISLHYYSELTMSEIGSMVGVKVSAISKIHAKALLNLETSMREMECRIQETTLQAEACECKPRRAEHNVPGLLAAFRKRA
jgi:RNA polymerase sigma factor for flagellar operon FliA